MGILDAPPTPRSRAGAYDQKAARAMRAVRMGIANRANAPVDIVCMGDSTFEGLNMGLSGGNIEANRIYAMPNRLAELLRQRFPTAGEVAVHPKPTYQPCYAGVGTTLWSLDANWSQDTSFGLLPWSAKAIAAGAVATLAIPAGCTAVDLLYVQTGSASTLTYSLDGTAYTDFTTGSTRIDGRTRVVPTGSNIYVKSKASSTWLLGAALYFGNESKGIRVWNAARSGTRLYQYSQQSGSGNFAWFNPSNVGPPGSAAPLAGIQGLAAIPNLAMMVLNWGINDLADVNTNGAANFKTLLQQFIAGVRAVLPTTRPMSFLLVTMYKPTQTSSTSSTWEDFRDVREQVAAADPDVAHVDFTKLMPDAGSTDAANFDLYFDGLHHKAKGHQLMADTLASLIAP